MEDNFIIIEYESNEALQSVPPSLHNLDPELKDFIIYAH